MKIKFNSDDGLLLRKTIKIYNMIIGVKSAFYEGSKYYPQIFLNNFLYKLQILTKPLVKVSVLFATTGTFLK